MALLVAIVRRDNPLFVSDMQNGVYHQIEMHVRHGRAVVCDTVFEFERLVALCVVLLYFPEHERFSVETAYRDPGF